MYRTLLAGRQGTLGNRADQHWQTVVWPRRLANESSFCLPRWLAVALHRQQRAGPGAVVAAHLHEYRFLWTMTHLPTG